MHTLVKICLNGFLRLVLFFEILQTRGLKSGGHYLWKLTLVSYFFILIFTYSWCYVKDSYIASANLVFFCSFVVLYLPHVAGLGSSPLTFVCRSVLFDFGDFLVDLRWVGSKPCYSSFDLFCIGVWLYANYRLPLLN